MRKLTVSESTLVAGGTLALTYHINSDGISPACIEVFVSEINGITDLDRVNKERFIAHCPLQEMKLFWNEVAKVNHRGPCKITVV